MLVTVASKRIRREMNVAPARKAPATAQRLIEMVRLCPATLPGQHDRALQVGRPGGCCRGAPRVTIRCFRTDHKGASQVFAIARGEAHCPVAAVQEWLATAGITTRPVLRRVRNGARGPRGAVRPRSG